MSHTPGPWKMSLSVDGDFLGIYPDTGKAEFPIAKMPEINRAEINKANARLIAASPALFEYVASSASAGCATAEALIAALTAGQRE